VILATPRTGCNRFPLKIPQFEPEAEVMGFRLFAQSGVLLFVFFGVGSVWVRSGAETPTGGRGARVVFPLHTATVSLEVPADWQAVRDLYNLPLSILSPDHSGGDPALVEDFEARRSLLAVIPTGANDMILAEQGMRQDQNSYYAKRKADLEQDGAVVVSTLPYRYVELSKKPAPGSPLAIHSLGITYRVGEKTFSEVSNYVICDFQVFLLKSVLHAEDRASDEAVLERIVRSFRCR